MTWRLRGGTHATARQSGRRRSISAPTAARVASSRSERDEGRASPAGRARRARRRSRRRSMSSAVCDDCHLTASRPPGKRKRRTSMLAPPARTAAAMNTVPTGLPGVPPSGPAMPVTASPQRRARDAADARRHRLGDGRADGAVGAQERLGHAEELLLGAVRVHDHAALDVARRARDVGQPVAEEPAGARLGHRDGEPALEQEPPDHRLERVLVLP